MRCSLKHCDNFSSDGLCAMHGSMTADELVKWRELEAVQAIDKSIAANRETRGEPIPMPDAVAPMPLKDFEALEKPGGTIIGNVYFICAVSKAQVAITMRQEGTKIHMTTSHRGVAQHTPVIELYSKLMKLLKEEG